jgi:hypothetical protein
MMATDIQQRYIFEIIDPTTRSIVYDIEVQDLAKFCELIDLDPTDMEPGASYEIEAWEVSRIAAAFDFPGGGRGREGLVRPASRSDQLPYKVHTGRELLLMLEGTKPLAVFSDTHPTTKPPFEIIPEDVYAPYVEAGRLVKREVIELPVDPVRDSPMRIVCYALPTEQWRIDAYLLLYRVGMRFGWSESCERMEGTLLGYTDEQNDLYIELIYRRYIEQRSRVDGASPSESKK